MKVLVVGNSYAYGKWLTNNIVDNIEEADLVIFTGGEDVNPAFYNEPFGNRTRFNTERDLDEFLYFNEAVKLGKPMLGICRGNQFLCVANKGKLVQHITGHALNGGHSIIDLESKNTYLVTSTHHQMAYPFELPKDNYKIIATSENMLSECYLNGHNAKYSEIPCEPEVIFYPQTKCLGIQYHPEYMDSNSEAIIYTKQLINKYLLSEKNQIDVNEKIIQVDDYNFITSTNFRLKRVVGGDLDLMDLLANIENPGIIDEDVNEEVNVDFEFELDDEDEL